MFQSLSSYKNRNDRKSRLEFLRNGEIEVNKFREEELYVALKKFQHEGQDRWSTRFFLLKGHRPWTKEAKQVHHSWFVGSLRRLQRDT